MPAPVRRVPKVIAGVVAMVASLSALATVVVSDFAQASVQPPASELTDELPVAQAVKLQKLDYSKQLQEEEERRELEEQLKRAVRFGRFEGY